MTKAQIQNRIKKLHTGVNVMQTAGDIPAGSATLVFLALLPEVLKGESFQDVFDA